MLKRIAVMLMPVAGVALAGAGYWLGTQEAARIAHGAAIEKFQTAAIDAQTDSAVLEILGQQRYKDAENIAKLRYYTRVLTVHELAAADPALAPKAQALVDEAKAIWKQHPFVLPSPGDHAKLLVLLK